MDKQILVEKISKEELKDLISEAVKQEMDKYFSKEQKLEGYPSRKQTSELLGVSLGTLSNWHHRNILIPRYIGNRVFYKRQDIEAAIRRVKGKE